MKVRDQILHAAGAISRNIEALTDQRGLLSQNTLNASRNLVEAVAVRLHKGHDDAEFSYPVRDSTTWVSTQGKLNFVSKFHHFLQITASHYSHGEDDSIRLMLKYYEYLIRIRQVLKDSCGIEVLQNLEDYPLHQDPSLREYHDRIAERVRVPDAGDAAGSGDRYYIHRVRPFFVGTTILYEVTYSPAHNRHSKFDRAIAFTDIDIDDKYAATLQLQHSTIEVLDRTLPITIIRGWAVSIRPCEFDNFNRFFNDVTKVRGQSHEYRVLMRWLTNRSGSLLDLMDLPDQVFQLLADEATRNTNTPQIFPSLTTARQIIRGLKPGWVLLRYLLLRLRNTVIKDQFSPDQCPKLSNLRLSWGCLPFEQMPFCSHPIRHRASLRDVATAIGFSGREHELLAGRVITNVENRGILYTPVADVAHYGDPATLARTFNAKLYHKHRPRRDLLVSNGHVFMQGYEDDTCSIITSLTKLSASGVGGYRASVEKWLDAQPHGIDDPLKAEALKDLFASSKVALIYGAAGTGKSTMVNHIASFNHTKEILFLAHTNPAVENLRRRVRSRQSNTFRTIASHLHRQDTTAYDLLVIDECSTVSNADLVKVLEGTNFQLLVLVGDRHQIEAIEFGNWFSILPSYLPATSVFELTTPWRTKNEPLLGFWKKVRNIDDTITEAIAKSGYSSPLDESLYESRSTDEIVLCLNYDGLYGINNTNRFLQGANPNPEIHWGPSIFKVDDPILFNDIPRFKPVIYNNLKGRIVGLDHQPGRLRVEVALDAVVNQLDVDMVDDLDWIRDSVVRFDVYETANSDEDDDSLNTVVPFQVAYAVAIHKAQGLEYDSVKVVITEANQDDISHSIFYTAITRTRNQLQILWTPATQHAVITNLQRASHNNDVQLLTTRRRLVPTNSPRKLH